MKPWIQKLFDQLEIERPAANASQPDISEERATLLYVIDTYSKHLIEVDSRSIRKVRAVFDEFAKGLLRLNGPSSEKLLFRFRQFFSSYRIQEYSYLQKTFEDFKAIIWDFADQLNESVKTEQARDVQVRESLSALREAVEANSINELKEKSREFIDFYIELQTTNDEKRSQRIEAIQNSLTKAKQKISEITESSQKDHLTGAYNRKFTDEALQRSLDGLAKNQSPSTILALDIDYFKKINDIFGHDGGDVVLKEFVRLLKEMFPGPNEIVARMGGEEFIVLLNEVPLMEGVKKTEGLLQRIRKETIIHSDTQIRYTVSVGVASIQPEETAEKWLKRADQALYAAKEGGRDQYVVAPHKPNSNVA